MADDKIADSGVLLGILAQGTIEPERRIAEGAITAAQVEHLIAALQSGELYVTAAGKIINKCIDGRLRADSTRSIGPDSAGGTISLVVADALADERYRRRGEPCSLHVKRLVGALIAGGQPVGAHDSDRTHDTGSGCGACDKLENALHFIADHAADIQKLLSELHVAVGDEISETIASRAAVLTRDGYADGGHNIIAAMRDAGGAASVETLRSSQHNEVVVVVNTIAGSTLDRTKRDELFGDEIQAFNVDVWAVRESAAYLARDQAEAARLFTAMLYYNVAVAAVLCGPSMRFVVR